MLDIQAEIHRYIETNDSEMEQVKQVALLAQGNGKTPVSISYQKTGSGMLVLLLLTIFAWLSVAWWAGILSFLLRAALVDSSTVSHGVVLFMMLSGLIMTLWRISKESKNETRRI